MKKIRIFLIEDDADDVQLLQEAMQDNQVDYELDVVMEGDKVIPHLVNLGSLPDIIVLDFNLPKLHGKEILRLIRSTHAFADVPVIVLTTSISPYDRQFAYDHGANKFISKPSSIQEFNNTVEAIVSMVTVI